MALALVILGSFGYMFGFRLQSNSPFDENIGSGYVCTCLRADEQSGPAAVFRLANTTERNARHDFLLGFRIRQKVLVANSINQSWSDIVKSDALAAKGLG